MSEGRILVAEDSAVIRALLRAQLTERGYEVFEAPDGAVALERARAELPDVILCDVEMPVLDGYGVLAAVQEDELLAGTPLVFLTGRTDSDEAAEGLRRGAYDYLRKPFEPVELSARVHSAMRTKVLQDELRQRNAELERISATDALTGLHNRRYLTEQLERAEALAARHAREWAVVMLDIDRFKSVNDVHGHAAGDAVLAEVAKRLQSRLREEDHLGRFGGEEFLVLLPDTNAEAAAHVAEDLRAAVADGPLPSPAGELPVTISAGWAAWDGDEPHGLVARADAALYEAKAAGRNRVVGATTAAQT
jgi:diguanylate cyclase (GGDEF)-like protein